MSVVRSNRRLCTCVRCCELRSNQLDDRPSGSLAVDLSVLGVVIFFLAVAALLSAGVLQ